MLWIRFEEKLAHLQKQAAFKTDAMAGEIEAIQAAIIENEKLYNEVRASLPAPYLEPSMYSTSRRDGKLIFLNNSSC